MLRKKDDLHSCNNSNNMPIIMTLITCSECTCSNSKSAHNLCKRDSSKQAIRQPGRQAGSRAPGSAMLVMVGAFAAAVGGGLKRLAGCCRSTGRAGGRSSGRPSGRAAVQALIVRTLLSASSHRAADGGRQERPIRAMLEQC